MTTYLPYRANVLCSLGHLIDGQFADTYLQQAGLIFCRGSVRLAGIYRPDIGTTVDFAYTRDNVTAARIPRRLRVLSSFADPFTKITTVQLGCKLSLLQDNRDLSAKVVPEDDVVGLPTNYQEYFASYVAANAAATRCLSELGITAAASLPLVNRYTVDEFDLSSGYVEVLGKLLESECYVGYLNDEEELVVRSLKEDGATAGPVVTAENVFTLSPIGVGALPGEAVTVSYNTLELNGDTISTGGETLLNRRGWGFSVTTGSPVVYTIQYEGGVFTGEYVPTSTTTTTFSGGRAIFTSTEDTKPYAAAAGGFASETLSVGVGLPGDTVSSSTETTNRYDSQGRVSETVNTSYVSLVEFAGRLQLKYVFSPSDRVVVPTGGRVPIERTVTRYSYSGTNVRRSVDRYQNWGMTQYGQQAVAAGNVSFTSSSQVADFYNSLTDSLAYVGTEVTISSSSPSPQTAPGAASLTETENGGRKSKSAELVYVFGSSSSDRSISFTLPYSPDDYYTFGSGVATPVSPGLLAKTQATNYGRVQNKLRLGNQQGASLQLPVEIMPTNPFDCLYLQADGLTGQYRANGSSWTFNSEGIVGQVDALFWLAIGQTGTPGTIWFPVPPAVSVLPTTPSTTVNGSPAPANSAAVPSGWNPAAPNLTALFAALPVATAPVFPSVIDTSGGLRPYTETVLLDGVGSVFLEMQSFPYSLTPVTTELDGMLSVVASMVKGVFVDAPTATMALTAEMPTLLVTATPLASMALTCYVPTVEGTAAPGGGLVNAPVVDELIWAMGSSSYGPLIRGSVGVDGAIEVDQEPFGLIAEVPDVLGT